MTFPTREMPWFSLHWHRAIISWAFQPVMPRFVLFSIYTCWTPCCNPVYLMFALWLPSRKACQSKHPWLLIYIASLALVDLRIDHFGIDYANVPLIMNTPYLAYSRTLFQHLVNRTLPQRKRVYKCSLPQQILLTHPIHLLDPLPGSPIPTGKIPIYPPNKLPHKHPRDLLNRYPCHPQPLQTRRLPPL